MPTPDPLVRETIAALPFCSDLPAELVDRLAAIGRRCSYRPRERIVAPDDPVRSLYVVRSGCVLLQRTRSSGERAVHLLRKGQTFGEVPLLGRQEHYFYEALATEYGTELVELAAGPFMELFERETALPAAMVMDLWQKVMDFVVRVEELSITSATVRLAAHLLRQPARLEETHPEVDLGMDRKDLAAALATTPEHLSRLLRRWADAGLIRPLGRTIALLQPSVLSAIADIDEPPDAGS